MQSRERRVLERNLCRRRRPGEQGGWKTQVYRCNVPTPLCDFLAQPIDTSRSVAQRTWDVPHLARRAWMDGREQQSNPGDREGADRHPQPLPGRSASQGNSWAALGQARAGSVQNEPPALRSTGGPSLRIALLALSIPLGASNGLPGSTHETPLGVHWRNLRCM